MGVYTLVRSDDLQFLMELAYKGADEIEGALDAEKATDRLNAISEMWEFQN